jgi:NTP pyrophosphatase (non-canonical NTP hydrolase)
LTIKLDKYQDFVGTTISDPSSDFPTLISRLCQLQENDFGASIPELMTAAAGLTSEAGEFGEVVKKIVFQGKPLDEDNIYHMERELGDICWYLAVACCALGTTLDEVLVMNVEKLSARYPAGFEVIKSEVRADGDI